jgi:hypothetical protein
MCTISFFKSLVDCITRSLSSFPNVTFTIGGQVFTLTPLQYLIIVGDGLGSYVCATIFSPSDSPDPNGNPLWTLGDYFLYRVYTIYDIINNQVGFARSISYNWTQSINSSLFTGINTTQSFTAITTTQSITAVNTTQSFTAITTTQSITAVNTTQSTTSKGPGTNNNSGTKLMSMDLLWTIICSYFLTALFMDRISV